MPILMIGLVLAVLVVMDGILLWLWLVRVSSELHHVREEVAHSWIQLREALFNRREIMPYLIASINFQEPEAVEAIGNACDLASSTTDIAEQAKSEARLNTALNKLLSLVELRSEIKSDRSFTHLCNELQVMEKRIEFLTEVYNKQVDAYNARLSTASVKALGLFVPVTKMALFPRDGLRSCLSAGKS